MIGIYQIRNIKSGFVYIGSSINVKNRISSHKYILRHNRSVNKKLQYDWNMYGESSFSFEIIKEVEKEELLEQEACFINKSENIYNSIKPKLIEYGVNLKKTCSICGLEKDHSEFHKDGHQKYGLKNLCKSCRSKKNIRKIIVGTGHKKFDKLINRSIYRAFKKKKEGFIWESVINISYKELKEHLEKQFDDVMNWDNYGSHWVIDKIIPTSMFKYSNVKNNEFKKAWSLKNLRPFPRKIHCKRKDKILLNIIDYYKLYDILPIGLLGEIE